MPHVIVKMQSGRTEEQKKRIAEALTAVVMTHAVCTEDAVSVSIEDVPASEWVETVYRPDILGKPASLYKKPGYDPL
jgi:4-oxalocrotonate tautomerase